MDVMMLIFDHIPIVEVLRLKNPDAWAIAVSFQEIKLMVWFDLSLSLQNDKAIN